MKTPAIVLSAIVFLLPSVVTAVVEPLAHFNLQGQGGIRDTAAPDQLENRVEKSKLPALVRQGSPKIMSSSPPVRRIVADSSIKFEQDNQCYNAPANFATGSNFLVEVWVYASKADDSGWHVALANGHGGSGFLIGQNGKQWKVLVGGVGDTPLGEVVAGKWTHLAVVNDGGRCSGWVDGRKVCDLPGLGGGAPNFSLGATSPGKEPFRGWISEARVATFKPGAFDPADFLMDTTKIKALQAAELAQRAKFTESLLQTPGATVTPQFSERPYAKDWLIDPPVEPSSVQIRPVADKQAVQVLLTNGLISRTFHITDENLGCISFRRIDQDIEFIRAIKPEVRVALNGNWQEVGGLTGAPDHAFITPEWLPRLRSKPGAFHLVGMEVGGCVKPYEWQPKCNAPATIAWPAKGQRVTFRFVAPATGPLQGVGVAVSYEIYDGIPVMMKTFKLINKSGKDLVVTQFEGEHLAVQPSTSGMMHVESDYSFGLANFRETSSGLGIHASGGRAGFKDYYLGGGTTRFLRDPDWGSMATLNPAEDIFLDDPESALLISRPPTGPNWSVKDGAAFDAFRTFEILNDVATGTERAFLAQRRFYRVLAPQSNEKLLEVHAPYSRDMKTLGPLLDQMHEIGFEQLQAPEHPGSFNYADLSDANVASMKAVCDYAKPYHIRVGAYQLVIASQGGWGADNNCIDPVTNKPGSAFGQSVCAASGWADLYYENMWKMFDKTGMGAFKPDGPFHGDPCAATNHPHHKGLEDSQWAQWKWMCDVLHEGQRRNLYLTIPDWYVLNGQTCTGMGYREATDNIDVALQTVILRQYIFDATFHKTAQMGWINLNTETLPGGMEKSLDKYERFFFTLLSSGAQVWVRGHRLYDGPQSKAMLLKWMAWYKRYYDVIHGDIIHLKRPDGRGLDYTLHVNSKPGARHKGLLLVFNPTPETVTRNLDIPLYYTGLTATAMIREGEGAAAEFTLDREFKVNYPVTIPPNGYTWFVIE